MECTLPIYRPSSSSIGRFASSSAAASVAWEQVFRVFLLLYEGPSVLELCPLWVWEGGGGETRIAGFVVRERGVCLLHQLGKRKFSPLASPLAPKPGARSQATT